MLGSFRFILALSVLLFHLTAMIPNLGQFAVECFYVISGYLITLILNETYHFEFRSFVVNRFLRLYPSYYIFSILTLVMWLTVPSMASFHPCWVWAGRAGDYVGNLLMFPWTAMPDHVGNFRFRLLPSTWSVAVEIVCYAILWLFTARTWWTAVATAMLSLAWHVYTAVDGMDPVQRYAPVIAAMLAFSIGSMTYRVATRISMFRPSWMASSRNQPFLLAAVLGFYVLNWVASLRDGTATTSPFFYLDMAVAAIAALTFHRVRVGGLLGRIDRRLGDLSYPVFLIQYPCGFIAWRLLGEPTHNRGWTIAIGGALIAIFISAMSIKLIDKPIAMLRSRIRAGAEHPDRHPVVA